MKPLSSLLLSMALLLPLSAETTVFPGADENTPSQAHYFTWINNTNEGPMASQTTANLEFFQWLYDEYGMVLDIYAFDAGAIDAPEYYGSTSTRKFKQQFPQGFGPFAEQAKGFGGRLGVWLGPDGFGDTPQEEQARIDLLAGLCRDHNFQLFKMDAVCGQLRDEKQAAFIRLMQACRKHSPDLIVLNHRLNLGKAASYPANTWEYPARTRKSGYTYYFPLDDFLVGKDIEVVLLGMKDGGQNLTPSVWLTARDLPFTEN